jgi:hypothetical protein
MYVCSYVAMKVFLFDTVFSKSELNTYQNLSEVTRKCHISERFLLRVWRVTWNQLCVRAVFLR